MSTDTRYQHQSWLTRRWRDRYLFLVPFQALRTWWFGRSFDLDGNPQFRIEHQICWSDAWSIARGCCDLKRNWIYSHAEVLEMEGQR